MLLSDEQFELLTGAPAPQETAETAQSETDVVLPAGCTRHDNLRQHRRVMFGKRARVCSMMRPIRPGIFMLTIDQDQE